MRLTPAALAIVALVLASPVTPLEGRLAAQAEDDTEESTSVGGYGEVQYLNATGPDTPGEANVRRFVVYLAHTFSRKLSFRGELELEDALIAGGEAGGEVALEQAYLDYQLSPAFTLRAGLVLPPIGIINETHEPPTFNGVERPAFDQFVIPSTWREIGIGATGAIPGSSGLNYRVYLVNGLRAEGFSAANGIRGGRQEGREASFTNPSLTGRLEWKRPGFQIGGSFWYGGSADKNPALGTGAFDNSVALVSADARYDNGPVSLRGVIANASIADATTINAVYGGQVGSRIAGAYVEGAYNLLSILARKSRQRLDAFARYEHFNTQAGVPEGVTRDETLARRFATVGLTYKPVYNVVFKGDYRIRRNQAGIGGDEVFGLGVGYQF